MNLAPLLTILPHEIKDMLKPYYRKVFPNELHVVFWPTIRCNYRCSYCIIHPTKLNSGIFPVGTEKSPDQWLAVMEKLPPAKIRITGGEPFIYRGLSEIINNLPSKHEIIGIVTNFSLKPYIYKKINKRLRLVVSFHREYCSEYEFVEKINELKERFDIYATLVGTVENISEIEYLSKFFSKNNIYLHIDWYFEPEFEYTPNTMMILKKYLPRDRDQKKMNAYDGYRSKICSAGKNLIYILPDGSAFTCFEGLQYIYSSSLKAMIKGHRIEQFKMGNVYDNNFRLNNRNISCSLPCKMPCDWETAIIRVA